ncbi:hypothetical protein G6725_02200 [Polynucleobacter paneuropaeus]|nr:hypothetical protein [Polynucleobacter paneuropaeus]
MTLLNNTNDGLHPELIVLFRTVAYFKSIPYEDLVNLCLPKIMGENDESTKTRMRGSLNNWIKLGLFKRNGDNVELIDQFERIKKSDIDAHTNELPHIAMEFVCLPKNATPIMDNTRNQGVSGDFILGASWVLAQDIYNFPTAWAEVESLVNEQSTGSTRPIQTDFRWGNLRFWMRYFGLATGESSSFKIDPTLAIKHRLKSIFGSSKELPAKDFLVSLSEKLPVLDFGVYRNEVEKNLNDSVWRKLNPNELSQSLSFALKRLELNGNIQLRGKSDTGSSYRLIGRDHRQWTGFETVVWDKKL